MENDKTQKPALSKMAVSGSVFLQLGMHVKIKENGNHGEDCGKVKIISKDLPLFNGKRAF